MRALLVLAPLALLLAGCGDKDGDGGSGFVTPHQSDDGAYVIAMARERAFEPDRAAVPTDSIVEFVAELEGCSVESEEPGGPDSGKQWNNKLVPRGDSYRWFAPDTSAEFHVFCGAYRDDGMTMVLRVG